MSRPRYATLSEFHEAVCNSDLPSGTDTGSAETALLLYPGFGGMLLPFPLLESGQAEKLIETLLTTYAHIDDDVPPDGTLSLGNRRWKWEYQLAQVRAARPLVKLYIYDDGPLQ